jgi:hypothetical protein
MDQQSCILEVENKRTRQKGLFYLQNGKILDAEIGSIRSGESAAMEIISWDDVNLNIRPLPKGSRPKKIEMGLMLLLMEASRLKDEKGEKAEEPKEAKVEQKDQPSADPEINQEANEKIKEGIEFLKKNMGESLLSASVISMRGQVIGETFGGKNQKMVEFCVQASELINKVRKSEFKMGKYFILALEGKIVILIIPIGKNMIEISLDSEKMKLGLFLNAILPKLISKYGI